MGEDMKVYVVVCEQYYANHWTVKGVFSTFALADEYKRNSPVSDDLVIYGMIVDSNEGEVY